MVDDVVEEVSVVEVEDVVVGVVEVDWTFVVKVLYKVDHALLLVCSTK